MLHLYSRSRRGYFPNLLPTRPPIQTLLRPLRLLFSFSSLASLYGRSTARHLSPAGRNIHSTISLKHISRSRLYLVGNPRNILCSTNRRPRPPTQSSRRLASNKPYLFDGTALCIISERHTIPFRSSSAPHFGGPCTQSNLRRSRVLRCQGYKCRECLLESFLLYQTLLDICRPRPLLRAICHPAWGRVSTVLPQERRPNSCVGHVS